MIEIQEEQAKEYPHGL